MIGLVVLAVLGAWLVLSELTAVGCAAVCVVAPKRTGPAAGSATDPEKRRSVAVPDRVPGGRVP
jgi:hypothetical protein